MDPWEWLLLDVESRAAGQEAAELSAEVRLRARSEAGRVSLLSRARASQGIVVTLATTSRIWSGRLVDTGPDWLEVDQASDAPADSRAGRQDDSVATSRPILVASRKLIWVSGLRWSAAMREGAVADRLDLRFRLRRLAVSRVPVRLHLETVAPLDGTLGRVGSDHVDLVLHPLGEVPRGMGARGVDTPGVGAREVRTVALSAVVAAEPRVMSAV